MRATHKTDYVACLIESHNPYLICAGHLHMFMRRHKLCFAPLCVRQE